MFYFNMKISHNFALFQDNDRIVVVDSFDYKNFEVRYGTIEKTELISTITPTSSQDLNYQLDCLINKAH